MNSMSFKQWVEQHDPKTEWDWENPENLSKQLVNAITDSGAIDLKELYIASTALEDPDFYECFGEENGSRIHSIWNTWSALNEE